MFENFNLKIFFILIPLFCLSQEPIKWLTSVEKKSDNSYILYTTAKIQDNWRLYSQNLEEGGALPTEFVFEDESIFDSFSIVSEPKPITKYDPIFQMDQSYFINEVIYSQEVVLKGNYKDDILTQNLYYQVCDDRVCIFQDVKLEYSLSNKQIINTTSFDYSTVSSSLNLDLKNSELLVNEYENEMSNNFSRRINILILGLLGGFLALLTPCVFPMIPLTVSFFQQKMNKQSYIQAHTDFLSYLFMFP